MNSSMFAIAFHLFAFLRRSLTFDSISSLDETIGWYFEWGGFIRLEKVFGAPFCFIHSCNSLQPHCYTFSFLFVISIFFLSLFPSSLFAIVLDARQKTKKEKTKLITIEEYENIWNSCAMQASRQWRNACGLSTTTQPRLIPHIDISINLHWSWSCQIRRFFF